MNGEPHGTQRAGKPDSLFSHSVSLTAPILGVLIGVLAISRHDRIFGITLAALGFFSLILELILIRRR
jgi:hypothetical protein